MKYKDDDYEEKQPGKRPLYEGLLKYYSRALVSSEDIKNHEPTDIGLPLKDILRRFYKDFYMVYHLTSFDPSIIKKYAPVIQKMDTFFHRGDDKEIGWINHISPDELRAYCDFGVECFLEYVAVLEEEGIIPPKRMMGENGHS